MRHVHLIAYDICQPKRYRQIYKAMKGAGDPLQYSVFRCELSDVELQQLKMKIWPLLNLDEDRVMIVNLGPVEGRRVAPVDRFGSTGAAQPEEVLAVRLAGVVTSCAKAHR